MMPDILKQVGPQQYQFLKAQMTMTMMSQSSLVPSRMLTKHELSESLFESE